MVNVAIYSIHGWILWDTYGFLPVRYAVRAVQDKDYIEHVKKRAREHKFKFKGHNMIYPLVN